MLVAALLLDGRHLRYRFTFFSCVGMDNLNQWIDDRQSFERARHQPKKKSDGISPKPPLCLLGFVFVFSPPDDDKSAES